MNEITNNYNNGIYPTWYNPADGETRSDWREDSPTDLESGSSSDEESNDVGNDPFFLSDSAMAEIESDQQSPVIGFPLTFTDSFLLPDANAMSPSVPHCLEEAKEAEDEAVAVVAYRKYWIDR